MNQLDLKTILERLMLQPTAPYHEHEVRREAEDILLSLHVPFERDRFGNVLARFGNHKAGRPLVLAAHMDHPGFKVVRQLGARKWLVRFRGGVPESHFRLGLKVRLHPGNMKAAISAIAKERLHFEVTTTQDPQQSPQFAMWDFPGFRLNGDKLTGCACDDVVGIGCILATFAELKRVRAKVNVIGVLSRAEEVGFHGALVVAAAGVIPRDSLVISLETSRELPAVKMGRGVILRVGDKASTFDSGAGRFLAELAGELTAVDSRFEFQRALMGGGTCEASAYQEFGYQTAAVCIALGNYHNCAPGERIRPEYVSMRDTQTMVRLLVNAAKNMRRFDELRGKLRRRLSGLLQEARSERAKEHRRNLPE